MQVLLICIYAFIPSQVQAVTSVGPGHFSLPVTVTINSPPTTMALNKKSVVIGVVVVLVLVIVLLGIVTGSFIGYGIR